MAVMRRYALYYAPERDDPLARFARSWLGRDPETDAVCTQRDIAGIPRGRQRDITEDPRHYGFHGTLKAPFPLADGLTEDDLFATAQTFAAARSSFETGKLVLKEISRFIALVPRDASADLNKLAADCVSDFDRFRAPLPPEELARRRAGGLSPRQDELLLQWGYPYVMEEFRFHLTLTGSLDTEERETVCRVLANLTAPFCVKPFVVRDLAIFMQDDRKTPFRIVARFPFAA
jgi:putative phosphonate metabolism protein